MRVVDDTTNPFRNFRGLITKAILSGSSWIEVEQDTIDEVLQGRSMGDKPYFIFENIRVYKVGTKEKCDEDEKLQLGRRLHGATEGIVEGR